MFVYIALTVFIAAAILGSILLKGFLKSGKTNKPVVFAHGIVAGLGIVILIVWISFEEDVMILIPLGIFFIAASLGSILFIRDLMFDKPGPVWLAKFHPVISTLGILSLIYLLILKLFY